MGVTLSAARTSRGRSADHRARRDEPRVRTSRVMPLPCRPADGPDMHFLRHRGHPDPLGRPPHLARDRASDVPMPFGSTLGPTRSPVRAGPR